ncbi:MAG: RHS domain-containing protein [Myxococcales bacterium]|nr:RHS domain-containing protein [Myxococcales bacterium]
MLGVAHTPVAAGTACGDGNLCNGDEICDAAGTCHAGTPLPTSDGDPCTQDVCDPQTGVVSHPPAPAGTACNLDACTFGALCDAAGQCIGGAPLPVDDGDACTIDLCDPVTGPRHVGCAPLDRTVSTNILDSMSWLTTGADPVQSGMSPGTIDAERAAVLFGRVASRAGAPIPGVTVSVLGHPEFGQTQTHADGRYFMMVNGGGDLVVDFVKSGFLPAQRPAKPLWGKFASTPDVVLVALSAQVTTVELMSEEPFQVARGQLETDANGSRQATLLFASGTTASAVMPDGTTYPLTQLNVRATEYTVGASGPDAMPAPLPPASMYTYAVELSADEALALGASVQFSQPVWLYLENFIDLPVGTTVPFGIYDRAQAVWRPQPSGVVLKVLDIVSGVAVIDASGDGLADSPTELAARAITDAERAQIAALYPVGATLWRTPVSHFTPGDCNMAGGPDPDDDPPPPPVPDPDPNDDLDDGDGDCDKDGASVIGCQAQRLRESLPIAGTPYSLRYSNDRLPGHGAANTLNLRLSNSAVPPRLKRIELAIEIQGRRHAQVFSPAPNQTFTFNWDGRDAFGRLTQGSQPIRVVTGYVYDVVYGSTEVFGGYGNGVTFAPNSDVVYSLRRTWEGTVGRWDARALGLGGWSLDVHHAYDPSSKTLFKGDGTRRSASSIVPIFRTLATGLGQTEELAVYPDGTFLFVEPQGNRVRRMAKDGTISTFAGSTAGYSGDGGPAAAARLRAPSDVVIAPDGTVYIADTGNHVVRRVGTDGIISTFAGVFTTVGGNPVGGLDGDGGPATSAHLSSPASLTYGPDGGLYINSVRSIRRVGPDGIINKIAGTGSFALPPPADDVPALQANLSVADLAFDREGNLYIADSEFSRVRRLDRAGRITTVAGCTGTPCVNASGVLATQRQLNLPLAVAMGSDDTLYVATANDQTVHAIGADGVIRRVAGGGSGLTSGAPATSVQVFASGIELGPNGRMYIAGANTGLHVIESAFPSLSASHLIASRDAGEVYSFDSDGRHLQTLDLRTGAARSTFSYGATGLLTSVADGDGNITTIQRDTAGTPTAVVGPFGQQTLLAIDSNGFLSGLTNPAGEAVAVTYSADGNLQTFTNARGHTSSMVYDDLGRLLLDSDPAAGSSALARTDVASGWSVARTSALGRTTSYLTEFLPTGILQQTNTFPDGTTAVRTRDQSGAVAVTTADGTLSTSTVLPDSRFSLLAPIVSSSTRTPSGLARNETRTRVIQLTDPANPLSLNRQTDTVTVNGRTTTTVFERPTLTTTVTTPAGRVTKTFHDSQMRLTRREVTGVTPLVIGYDSRGRPTTATQGPRTRTTTYFSTSDTRNGYVQWVTNALSQTTSFSPDGTGRILQQLDPDGALTSFSWDGNGNLTSVTPPGQPSHGQSFTPVDLLSAYTPPAVPGVSAPATLFSYNVDRQLTQTTRPDGLLVGRTYDSAGKLDLLTTPTGNVDYDYFGLTPCPGCAPGRLARITDPSGVVLDHSYDGHLLKGVAWSGAVAGSVSFGHDASFRTTSETVTVGATSSPVAFGYDNDDILICASPSTCSPAGTDALKITLNAGNGFVTGSTHGVVTDTLTYNAFGELAIYTGKVGATEVFSEAVDTTGFPRDSLGRITRRVETNGGVTTVWLYAYDTRGRLTNVQRNGALYEHYDYDANGNRTLLTTPTGTTVGVFDAQDRLLSYGSATYTYTANGELSTKTDSVGTTTHTYDVRGNLVQVDLPGGDVIQYLVDGQDRRVGKKKNGVLERAWLYRNQLNPVAELDGSGALVARFVYGSKRNVPEYMVRGGVTYRVLSDHLGSPRAVVDVATGTIAWRADFDAWGNRTLIAGTVDFLPFGFAGGMLDPETGLTRFGARDYDANIGRWTTREPRTAWRENGTNLIAYAANDPINMIDPDGLAAVVDDLVWIGTYEVAQAAAIAYSLYLIVGGGGHCGNKYLECKKKHPSKSVPYSPPVCGDDEPDDLVVSKDIVKDEKSCEHCLAECMGAAALMVQIAGYSWWPPDPECN